MARPPVSKFFSTISTDAPASRAEIGPERIDETELGVGGFPQQEVRQSFFAARADQEIDVRGGLASRRGEQGAEGLAGGRLRGEPARRRLRDGITRRIVDGDLQI